MEAGKSLKMPVRIAGEGDLSEELRAIAETRGADQVEFLGYLTPEALRKETQDAWLGFNLLENRGLSYYYSLANKFFDYLQAGLPQLAPDFPEYRRINERWEVAVLIDEPDPQKIAEAVQALRKDPERWARMRANCLKAREVLCWENLEPELRLFYRNLKHD
jgi:glycosyltransferase involved in cell wall biosynthesis